MTATTVLVYDATNANIAHLPAGMAAGYTTGSSDIRWTASSWAKHPQAVRIDQDAAASDPTADVIDVEAGAATIAEVPGWVIRAAVDYHDARRPGQRSPAVYCSRSNVTAVCNALIAAGVKGGVGLWIADWDGNHDKAAAEVANASGPFPVIGRQYANAGLYDVSVFSAQWLQEVSVAAPVPPPVPPGQWKNPGQWTWKDVYECGIGVDGKFHIFHLENGEWVKLR